MRKILAALALVFAVTACGVGGSAADSTRVEDSLRLLPCDSGPGLDTIDYGDSGSKKAAKRDSIQKAAGTDC